MSNLGGKGPDTGKPSLIRYSKVGTFYDTPFDLVVTATSPLTPSSDSSSGCSGQLGMIALISGTYVNLKFKFVNSATQAPITLPSFDFVLLDLDDNSREEVYVEGFSSFKVRTPLTNVRTPKLKTGRSMVSQKMSLVPKRSSRNLTDTVFATLMTRAVRRTKASVALMPTAMAAVPGSRYGFA